MPHRASVYVDEALKYIPILKPAPIPEETWNSFGCLNDSGLHSGAANKPINAPRSEAAIKWSLLGLSKTTHMMAKTMAPMMIPIRLAVISLMSDS